MMAEVTITSASQGATEADLQQALGVDPQNQQVAAENSAEPAENSTPKTQDKPEEKEGHRGFERRINKLTRANAELREMFEEQGRKLAEAVEKLSRAADAGKAPEATSNNGRPQPLQQNFKSYEDFIEAMAEWKFNQKWEERQRQESETEDEETTREIFNTYNERVADFAADHDDFDEVLSSLSSSVAIPKSAALAIYELDNGPEVSYYLAKNPDEAKRLTQLSDSMIGVEIGRISDKLSKPAAPPKVTSRAPAPPVTVGGTSQSSVSLDKLSYREYDKARRMQSRRA